MDLGGAIAVLIGLLFVGLELRQNTKAIEASNFQNQTDASTDFVLLIASDPEMARLWLDASKDISQLNEVDSIRYFFLSRARWLRMQTAYLQWRRGTLSDEDWSIYEGFICRVLPTGEIRFKSTWDEHKLALLERFVDFVDNCWANSQ